MLSYHDALQLIIANVDALQHTTVSLHDAINKVCAATVISSLQVPYFNNAAMDGFAVCAQHLVAANNPVLLPVAGVIRAGDAHSDANYFTNISGTLLAINSQPKLAIEINTGAPLPAPFDTVIKLEDVKVHSHAQQKFITINTVVKPQQNVRYKGEDIGLNDVVINQGDIISPAHIMALAAIGLMTINTYKLPKVAIIATGNELTTNNNQQCLLTPGKIYDTNTPYLQAVCQQLQLPITLCTKTVDEEKVFIDTLQQAYTSVESTGLIITTGAVSRGARDFIPTVLQQLGAEIILHKVRIKPGKPILFARLKTGQYFFGLPGNPLAVAVGMRFFVYPLLRAMQLLPPEVPQQAEVTASFPHKSGLSTFYKAKLWQQQGKSLVTILSGQESFKIKSFVAANCWAYVDEAKQSIEAGEILSVYT